MKKTLVIVAVAALALMLFGCGKASQSATPEEETKEAATQAVSIMEESSADDLVQQTGIALPAPEGATYVAYYLYKSEPPMGEMRFQLDGKPYRLRAQSTEYTELPLAKVDFDKAIENGKQLVNPVDISGMYYPWVEYSDETVNGRPAQTFFDGAGVGFLSWVDSAPGIAYSLSVDEGTTSPAELVSVASKVFVPVQGEVG